MGYRIENSAEQTVGNKVYVNASGYLTFAKPTLPFYQIKYKETGQTMSKIIATARAENNTGSYTTELQVNQYTFIADEPKDIGGQDLGPKPGDYLCMALASCTAITLRMYAQRKGWSIEQISVKVDLAKSDDTPAGNQTFYCEVSVKGNLAEEQMARLLQIAKACPIHRLLTRPCDVITTLS